MDGEKSDQTNYDDRTKQLMDLRDDAERQFDRQIVYLSAGGLIFSIGFVKDIIGCNSVPIFKWILIVSWITFALSLIINLVSHITSKNAFTYEITGDKELCKKMNGCTICLNWISIITFLLGVISLISFALLNF